MLRHLFTSPLCYFRCELRSELSRVQNGASSLASTPTLAPRGMRPSTKGLSTAARKIRQAFFKQTFYPFKSESKSLYNWQSINSSWRRPLTFVRLENYSFVFKGCKLLRKTRTLLIKIHYSLSIFIT